MRVSTLFYTFTTYLSCIFGVLVVFLVLLLDFFFNYFVILDFFIPFKLSFMDVKPNSLFMKISFYFIIRGQILLFILGTFCYQIDLGLSDGY